MDNHKLDKPQIELRPPSKVMTLARIGSMHQTRLSFMRVLLRRMANEAWSVKRVSWDIDSDGVGVAVYVAAGPVRQYSLVVFSHALDPAKRSDRVIAEEWDATFTLVDGIADTDDIDRLKNNVPKQEAGRISVKEICLSRANRSVRLFDYVRKQLAQGMQPESAELDKVGYLMRTTAVYGSGKFGAVDRQFISDRPEFTSPFQCELLSVYMIRLFSVDIVEHLASADAPDTAVVLDKNLRRSLGIGNSTGLGMAPFIVNHPVLFHHWMYAREVALLRVRQVTETDDAKVLHFKSIFNRQQSGLDSWTSEHPVQIQKLKDLRKDFTLLSDEIHSPGVLQQAYPWNLLVQWSETHLTLEGQEYLVSLLIECYPELVDELATTMSVDEDQHFRINGKMKVAELIEIIDSQYQFAIDTDFTEELANARFWYASEEKLEPRLGERFEEEGADREHPLTVARDVALAFTDLCNSGKDSTVAQFLLELPEHRHVVRRVQQSVAHPYAEIHNNLIASDMMPIDMLRCKLSYFGAVKFDPRSDRWVRINMFQHAPLPDELLQQYDDTWVYPPEVDNA